MAKFNTYSVNALDEEGRPILVGEYVDAISFEAAWMKAVAASFNACEPGTGIRPHTIEVHRVKQPSESHG